jgi:hypothetical protein
MEDFLPYYPTENFGLELAKQKEFAQLKLEPTESRVQGELLNTQKIVERFLSPHTPYPGVAVFHAPGSGKTCAASVVVENFSRETVDGLPRRPALILVKGEDLKRTFINEVANVCVQGKYVPKPTAKELAAGVRMTEAAKIARLNSAIAKTYQIETFDTFLRGLRKDQYSDYNNAIIVIDEAHHFYALSTVKPKRGMKPQLFPTRRKAVDELSLYWKLHEFLHSLQGTRVMLMTGTPIWDRVDAFPSLINLILDLKSQLPVGSLFVKEYYRGDQINPDKVLELKRKLEGKISYVRMMESSAKRIEMGVTEPLTKVIKVYADVMSPEQSVAAQTAKENSKEEDIVPEGDEGGAIWREARDAATCVYPTFGDKSDKVIGYEYGKEAFEKYCVKKVTRGDKVIKTYEITDKRVRQEFRDRLHIYSSKWASIIEKLNEHKDEIALIVEEFVEGAGAILLSLILELHGFNRIRDVGAISHVPSEEPQGLISTTKSGMDFAVITSNAWTIHDPKKINDLLREAGKPSNKYGKYLRIFIGSGKFKEGFTIKNGRQVHNSKYFWHKRFIEQADARVFRVGAHDALPPNERYIRIFSHAAVDSGTITLPQYYSNPKSYPPSGSGVSTNETTDLLVYHKAEQKEPQVASLKRILKEVAFDCPLTYARNVLAGDVNGSSECDYRECNYECEGFPPTSKKGKVWSYDLSQLDTSNYDLYYSSKRKRELEGEIHTIFSSYFAMELPLLFQRLAIEKNEENLVLLTLDEMISTKTLIKDRLGFFRFLKEDHDMFFLDVGGASVNYAQNVYVRSQMIPEYKSMDQLIEMLEIQHDVDLLNENCMTFSVEDLERLSPASKFTLIEEAKKYSFVADLKPSQITLIDSILDSYDNDLYTMNDGNVVHILHSMIFKGQRYTATVKKLVPTGKMRVLDDRGKWYTLTDSIQETKYLEEIKKKQKERKTIISEATRLYGVYGIVSKNKEFRIVMGDTRGRVCSTIHIDTLIDIFVSVHQKGGQILPTPLPLYDEYSKKDLIKLIHGKPTFSKHYANIESESVDYLRRFLTLILMTHNKLCSTLQKWFSDNNLLYKS